MSITQTRFYTNIYNNNEPKRIMKTEKKLNYEAPQVEVIEVQIEQGFAASNGDGELPFFGNGGGF